VLASVHHAEVVAHRVGEPFGTLILAVSVTVIEVALIVSMMLAGGTDKSALARDTIFAAVMIICNGVVGLCVIAGGLKHHEQSFRLEGATSALAALIVLATLSLVLPVFTPASPGGTSIASQLAFAAAASLPCGRCSCSCRRCAIATTSSARAARRRVGTCATAVGPPRLVELRPPPGLAGGGDRAGQGALADDRARRRLGRPAGDGDRHRHRPAGAAPESWAAVRAARADRLQTSLNLALGSALASIGLTIPTVAILSLVLERPLRLGLRPRTWCCWR
jgi:Ca2+:H+ antiporter